MVASPEDIQSLVDPDEEDECSYYELEASVTTPFATDSLEDYIDAYKGRIVHNVWDDEATAGRFRATYVRTEDAADNGIPPYMLWDHTEELCQHYGALFAPRTDRFKGSIETRFEAYLRDTLFLDEIEVLPAHRGKNLGLATAIRLIKMLARPGCLIVAMPHPLQFGGMQERDPERWKELGMDAFTEGRDAAFRRLRRYWGAIGLKRISPKDLRFAMSGGWRLPDIDELCPKL